MAATDVSVSEEARGRRATTAAARLPLLAACAAIVGILLIYRGSVAEMVRLWFIPSYQHGWLVVPVCLWLVWEARHRLAEVTPAFDWRGLVLFVPVVLAWAAGELFSAQLLEHLALVAAIPAVLLATLGWNWVRRVWFPLALLFFAVPFGEPLLAPLMHITADGTVWFLRLCGLTIYSDGFFFSTTVGDFRVAETCSGIRYIIAFLFTGALYAFLTLRRPRNLVIFGLVTCVLPVIANVLRASGIVLLAHFSDMKLAVGVDHFIYGWVFFCMMLAVLLAFGEWLRRREVRQGWHAPAAPAAAPRDAAAAPARSPAPGVAGAAACVALAGVSVFTAADVQAALDRPAPGPQGLPAAQGGWVGPMVPSIDWAPLFPGDPTLLRADYEHPSLGRVAVAVIHFPTEGQGRELVSSGNGLENMSRWDLAYSTDVVLPGGRPANGVTLRSRRDGRAVNVWWFYALHGETERSDPLMKVNGTIGRWRTGEAGVAIAVAIPRPREGDGATAATLTAFFEANLAPLLACSRPAAHPAAACVAWPSTPHTN